MNRRTLFKRLAGATAMIAVGTAQSDVRGDNNPWAVPVKRADGRAFILGVATETVHAGDFVQIQTHGSATVNMR